MNIKKGVTLKNRDDSKIPTKVVLSSYSHGAKSRGARNSSKKDNLQNNKIIENIVKYIESNIEQISLGSICSSSTNWLTTNNNLSKQKFGKGLE